MELSAFLICKVERLYPVLAIFCIYEFCFNENALKTTGLLLLWKVDSKGRLQPNAICQHSLQEQLTYVVLKPAPPIDENNDLRALARAAVEGDERALDMFTWTPGKGPSGKSFSFGPQEGSTFFIGGQNGSVYYLNESGKVVKQFSTDGAVRKLLYYEEKNILITITTTMMLTQHSVTPDGETREILMVKLSGRQDNPDTIWAGAGILATCTGESVIRMWDLEREENYVLSFENHGGYDRTELIMCLVYCPSKGTLAAGTGAGHVAMWKYSPAIGAAALRQEPEDRWKLQPPSTVNGPIADLAYGSCKNLLAVNTVDEVFILTEQEMSAHCQDEVAVVQTGPMQLSIDLFHSNSHQDLKADIKIKGVYNTRDHIAIWDGKKVVVYEINNDNSMIRAAGTFLSESPFVCLYEHNVYTLEPGKVQVRTFQGTVKQLLNLMEAEGDPVCMEVCSHFLIIGTTGGIVKLYDLSRREAKIVSHPCNLADTIIEFGRVISAKCNSNGSKVSIITEKRNSKPNPKLYIWDVELDTLQFFSFETGHGEQDELLPDLEPEHDDDETETEKGKNQAAKDIAGRFPISHFWDKTESKLLVCEAQIRAQDQLKDEMKDSNRNLLNKHTMSDEAEVMVVTLFSTPESGIIIQDSFSLSQLHDRLVCLQVPYFYFTKKSERLKEEESVMTNLMGRPPTSAGPGFQAMVSRRIMRDFYGLENADSSAQEAMMNFSYYLTIGNMDEAFKAIKLIKSESVWENMAKMCVKTRRLDVATVCLGNMAHARGAKFLREATKQPELDARVAALAMQLGLQEDAERLLKSAQRYDLLNQFYQANGQWNKALETAEMYDRIHLRTTYYNYAKYLESKGDISAAIPNYEKSDTHRFEVPRMLFDEPQALESYIMKTKDSALRKWWAQYMESTGEMESALEFYSSAKDILSLVRVYCYCQDLNKAAEICNETGDKAACYHLARQYENNENPKEAIHFFTRAGAYGNAIRLCREHGSEDQIMNLALLAKPEDMIEAARYYEFKNNQQDKAIMLYHKAGLFSKALDLAFNSKQFAALQMISEDLDEKTDPELLQRCADFFIENGQFDRAVDLLAVGKKYWDALKICMEQHVPMTEELVEKLTPGKEEGQNDVEERNRILEGIAEVCMQQRQYHLATKKYTQSGNKVKAMKALLKSGDTEKIVFFAGVSRQKEIYVMAANYLQSLDWRKDPEIMKNIISFYTKGRALDSLASFYDACAQVEIDEFQNYEKALGAMGEAYKCLTKARMSSQSLQEEKLSNLKNRLDLVKKFIQARRGYEVDSEEAIKQCQVLLEENDIDSAVRIGDILGFMIQHYAKKEKWKAAYNCIEEMRSRLRTVNLSYYVDPKIIAAVHQALDIPMKETRQTNGFRMGGDDEEEDGEEVEEDVIDN
ncbi:hypothetical protein LSH36_179g04000 [Paralvinella palmiformis]|uniref:Intraflagellar transport protein 140 homolog n=1 Tax=Paralvinella palmiformis TaxID=53620 RepID=A0AAD9JTN2_9ANNE|nr:hypothetical protein LSH36_179g04000 [Paralvinella palmiformis]